MGNNQLPVLQRKPSDMILPLAAQPLNPDASFSSFLSVSCCFPAQNCRIAGKNEFSSPQPAFIKQQEIAKRAFSKMMSETVHTCK